MRELNSTPSHEVAGVEPDIQELLILASRLKESTGGELDDEALRAVAEATGAPLDYVRIAAWSAPGVQKRQSLFSRVRSTILSLDESVRFYVISTLMASGCGLAQAFGGTFGDRTGFFGILTFLFILGAAYNAARAHERKIAVWSGAIFGAGQFIANSLFLLLLSMFFRVPRVEDSFLILPMMGAGALGGLVANAIFGNKTNRLNFKTPTEERQALLKQLLELQDKLRANEQHAAYLSLDIVGSTRMKATADPLAIEFTFNEFHRFVETIVKKHSGSIHSTAGDGVTAVFEHPQQAFAAARNIQGGLVELNTHRNRLGTPITLRAGIHYGQVVPPGENAVSVNFAHVIDVAVHMQKAAPPGGIAISSLAASMIPNGSQLIQGDPIEVQNTKAIIWQPKPILTASTPPPSPPQFAPEV